MRKVLFFILILFLIPTFVLAKQENVSFSKCVDGDTIKIKKEGKEYTVRFLAVDTPETVKRNNPVEPFGKEASNYTCKMVSNAKKLTLEYDKGSSETDKYGRLLAWVYTDGVMLQEELIKNGYAEVAYLYGKYAYTEYLQDLEQQAKEKKVGIWSLTDDEKDGCVIDGKIIKKSSGKCGSTETKKNTIKSTKKSKKSKNKEESLVDVIADFFVDTLANSIARLFDNLF